MLLIDQSGYVKNSRIKLAISSAIERGEMTAINGIDEPLTEQQQVSLSWLIDELTRTLEISMMQIFKHPDVSWKNKTEGSSAVWGK